MRHQNRKRPSASRARRGGFTVAALAAVIALAGCGGGSNNDRIVAGTSQTVAGSTVSSWARMNGDTVTEAGVTVPIALLEAPPATPGAGPAGALVTLPFPAEVANTTFINHFEMQWNPQGHPPNIYMQPHFDFHFYAITPDAVMTVTPPDTVAPSADRVPAGYTYPGVMAAVPQMGVHAGPNADMAEGAIFTSTMIMGYWGGQMTFVEPMVTQAKLMQKQSFTMAVPRPAVLGRATRFPTRMTATWDDSAKAYQFVLTDFVTMSG